jgi:NTP pyrophosphatase (non-canonical NTP hydrolase)
VGDCYSTVLYGGIGNTWNDPDTDFVVFHSHVRMGIGRPMVVPMIVTPILGNDIDINPDLRRLYARCVSAWGIRAQVDMAQEECAELIVALNHERRHRVPSEKVLEEIADVMFMCDELMYIYGFDRGELRRELEKKIERTEGRVTKYESIVARDTKGCEE